MLNKVDKPNTFDTNATIPHECNMVFLHAKIALDGQTKMTCLVSPRGNELQLIFVYFILHMLIKTSTCVYDARRYVQICAFYYFL